MVANAGKACSFTLRFVFVCALDQEALSLGGDWRGENHVHRAGTFRRGTHEQVCQRFTFLSCWTPRALQGGVPEDLWPAEQVRHFSGGCIYYSGFCLGTPWVLCFVPSLPQSVRVDRGAFHRHRQQLSGGQWLWGDGEEHWEHAAEQENQFTAFPWERGAGEEGVI